MQRYNSNGTTTNIKTYTISSGLLVEGTNRYYLEIDKSLLQNGVRYFLVYKGSIVIEPDYYGLPDEIVNMTKLEIITKNNQYGQNLDNAGNRKYLIRTKITRQNIIYE